MMIRNSILILILAFLINTGIKAQADSTSSDKIYDVVLIRGGSKLTGTILKWELDRGMEFQMITGAIMVIAKNDIVKVYQDLPLGIGSTSKMAVVRGPRVYSFREHGMYHTFSGFLNISDPGGAGLSYSIGHRFNRMLGIGVGGGIETNDFFNDRDMIPVYAEARGYFKAARISPYYAMKIGYGFPLRHAFSFEIDADGGIYVSPEIGVRFGGRSVNFYAGLEFKLQKARYVDQFWDGGTSIDEVTYKRMELRTGLTF